MGTEITWDGPSSDLVNSIGLDTYEAEQLIRNPDVRLKVGEGRRIVYGPVKARAFEIEYVVRIGPSFNSIEVIRASVISIETLRAINAAKEAAQP
jgi:hypothetical protein